MAFECPHCGFRNNELQSAGVFNERGHTISLSVNSKEVSALLNKNVHINPTFYLGYEPSISKV
jgi:C4-type Zn-finger protein